MRRGGALTRVGDCKFMSDRRAFIRGARLRGFTVGQNSLEINPSVLIASFLVGISPHGL